MKLPQRTQRKKKPSASQLKGQYAGLTIEGLTHDGRGVARIDGKAVFIRQAVPGDVVDIKILQDENHYAEAKVVAWQEHSTASATPFCRYYGQCGGCSLQHISLSAQRYWKQQNFFDQLCKTLDCRKLEKMPLVGFEHREYRRRARFVLGKDPKTKQACMGFRQADSHQIIDIESCPILTPALNKAYQQIRFDLLPLASRTDREIQLVEAANGIWLDATAVGKPLTQGSPYYELNTLKLEFSPQGFIQVNADVNQVLVSQACQWLDLRPTSRVLDLFCGVGNFTLALAKQAAHVVGIEGNTEAVTYAKNNAQHNQLLNATFYQTDLFKPFDHQAWWRTEYDAVLLDPGRQGAQLVCQHLSQINPTKIVYVSCNSVTLIRDLQLLETQGYRITRAAIFDMFSHTSHFESLVLMEKR